MAATNGNEPGKKKLRKAKPLPDRGGAAAARPAVKPVAAATNPHPKTTPVGSVVPAAATAAVVVQPGSGSATSIRRRTRKSRNKNIALILVMVPLIALGGILAFWGGASDDSQQDNGKINLQAAAADETAGDVGAESTDDVPQAGDTDNSNSSAAEPGRSVGNGNQDKPDLEDQPGRATEPGNADDPALKNGDDPAAANGSDDNPEPIVETAVDPPPEKKPVGPDELLKIKGFAKTESGWMASEEVALKMQLERAQVLEDEIEKTAARITPQKLKKLNEAIRDWMVLDKRHKNALAQRSDVGLTPELDKISALANRYRAFVKTVLASADGIRNEIVEHARELGGILEAAEKNIAAAKEKYANSSDDEQIAGALMELGGKLGPSDSWQADQAKVNKLKMRLPELETPPSLNLTPLARDYIARSNLRGEIAKEKPDPDAPPKK